MKKKLIMITSIVVIVVMAVAGTALASNGSGANDGNASRFEASIEDFETEEEFHAAVLAEKMVIIEAKVADGSMTQEEADALVEYLTACDGTCETEGENPNRPEEGWGIFGRGTGDGEAIGEGNGYKGANGEKGAGNGERLADCDEDGEPIQNGSGSENGQGYMGGKNK